MRVKSVPEPPGSIDALGAIRRAVPLVPEPEASCCERLAASTAIDPEDTSDWLTFLKGVELVEEGESGFHRTREDPDLGEALLSGVYGAREVREILEEAGEPLAREEVAERFDAIPRWERHHHRDPEAVWRERIERLLGWLVLVGAAKRVETGYVAGGAQR